MRDSLETPLRDALQPALVGGEELLGVCAATQQKLFSGWMVAIGTTDRGLVLQRLDRKLRADGPPIRIAREDVVEFDAEGTTGAEFLSALLGPASITLRIRTRDGQKHKLMMMPGGDGLMGRFGGGEAQRTGVEALGRWLVDS
jgi:hypothetical protein